ncbi:hypothetical protein EV130_101761 [Rhizobium azibense]|uniref:Uncharacterized protein n=1 Tax=Rhizobium azibense TaxID=1136135 RepID=A0A4V2VFK2_9HYPH|nr:hypothetical protein EV130_101761 [Rhizobium azibense]TCU40805.1 hypothetical protein EV129_10190 [Rhizobium azibense]
MEVQKPRPSQEVLAFLQKRGLPGGGPGKPLTLRAAYRIRARQAAHNMDQACRKEYWTEA